MAFIRKVYTILTFQILLTTGLSTLSFFSTSYRNWIQGNPWMMWVSLFGAIGVRPFSSHLSLPHPTYFNAEAKETQC
jgi:FtsH-binding integral membrane protein